jgi:hypothetical protein
VLDGRYGEVVRIRDLRRADRRLQFDVALPGYGLPTAATMTLIERWHLTAALWRLADYTYDYLLEPRGSGRRAHHLHDGVLHAHCEDPRPRHDHYRDVAVDLLEAAEEFANYFALGTLTCAGLFPL